MKSTKLQQILNDHKLWLDSNGERGARAYFENADLKNADLRNANLYKANLGNAVLKNADLEDANLEYADLRNTNLYKANLEAAYLENANLKNADLKYANIKGATGIYSFGPIGKVRRIGYAVKHETCVMVQLGCFWGTSDEAIEEVRVEYGTESLYEKQIKLAVEILNK